jgi:hypothetical protein
VGSVDPEGKQRHRKKEFGELGVSELRELRQLREENGK